MSDVADFSKYKARKDYDLNLQEKGWSATRLASDIESGVCIYVYDDYTGLLLFSVIEQSSLFEIRARVGTSNKRDLLSLTEKLNLLINDLTETPPDTDDLRLSAFAHTAAWFTGFLLAMVKKPELDSRSIALFRLYDQESRESAFYLSYLDWPDIMARQKAKKELSAMASMMRCNLHGLPEY